jgi:hypothetical protein
MQQAPRSSHAGGAGGVDMSGGGGRRQWAGGRTQNAERSGHQGSQPCGNAERRTQNTPRTHACNFRRLRRNRGISSSAYPFTQVNGWRYVSLPESSSLPEHVHSRWARCRALVVVLVAKTAIAWYCASYIGTPSMMSISSGSARASLTLRHCFAPM